MCDKRAKYGEKSVKIGFFDSGTGGLNVLYEAFLNLPQSTQFVYFADHDNVPYGNKSKDEIRTLLKNALNFLKAQNCDAIVIACNTASSVADMDFRYSFGLPIVAMEPAIKLAFDLHKNKRILLCATNATIKGEKLANLIKRLGANCDLIALPELVEFAQNAEFSKACNLLGSLGLEKYDIIVLGCTHFNYFKQEMKKANPALSFIDGDFGTIKHLANKLGLSLKESQASIEKLLEKTEFFISSRVPNDDEMEFLKLSLKRAKESREIK